MRLEMAPVVAVGAGCESRNSAPIVGWRRRVTTVAALAMTVLLAPIPARADVVIDNGGYHAQVTAYFCAAASVEMALDVPAVTSTNPIVAQFLAAGDGPTLPFFSQPPSPFRGRSVLARTLGRGLAPLLERRRARFQPNPPAAVAPSATPRR